MGKGHTRPEETNAAQGHACGARDSPRVHLSHAWVKLASTKQNLCSPQARPQNVGPLGTGRPSSWVSQPCPILLFAPAPAPAPEPMPIGAQELSPGAEADGQAGPFSLRLLPPARRAGRCSPGPLFSYTRSPSPLFPGVAPEPQGQRTQAAATAQAARPRSQLCTPGPVVLRPSIRGPPFACRPRDAGAPCAASPPFASRFTCVPC